MRAVFETGADLGLVDCEKMQGREKSLATDFATEEMCSFQDRSDLIPTAVHPSL